MADYVTKEEFEKLVGAVQGLVKVVTENKAGVSVEGSAKAVQEEKEIKRAGPNKYTVNPEWEALAKEIIGDAVDHTEQEFTKGGGIKFTVVIKTEQSNAPESYMQTFKVDRRTKEIGTEGESGVKEWCERIKNNLKREKAFNA